MSRSGEQPVWPSEDPGDPLAASEPCQEGCAAWQNPRQNSNIAALGQAGVVSSGLDGPSYQVIQDAVLGLWDVVNRLTVLPPPRSDRYRVTIFGSARMERETPLYQGVCNLARQLTLLGCDIVTGGGPGLMQAANEGSVLGDPDDRTQSIGIRVHLDFEQAANPFVEQVYQHRTFFTRLHHFMWISDAFVVVPGGIGTCLEMFMVWQLLQVKELNKPLILVGPMWKELVQWADCYMRDTPYPMVKESDLRIPCCVASFDEAITLLDHIHQNWSQETEASGADPLQE